MLDTPQGHMTRDVREGTGHLFGLSFRVFDTAGLEPLYAPPAPGAPHDRGDGTPQGGSEPGRAVGAPEGWEGEGDGRGVYWDGSVEGARVESAAGPSPPSVLRRTASITSFLVQQADAVLFLFDARYGAPGSSYGAQGL